MWKELAPEVEGESVVCPADDSNEVVLTGLDDFFGYVPAMIIRRNELVRHARVSDCLFLGSGDFVVQDWEDPTCFHPLKCLFACKYEFAFGFVLGRFDPDGVAVNMVQDHLIPIALAG